MQLIIVTGFLGAGKTTFVRAALEAGMLGRVALLVNEFGAVDIDGNLLADAGAASLRRLPNGCVCCAVQGEFLDAMLELGGGIADGSISVDRIVLETSGLADPAPLVARLVANREVRRLIDGIEVIALVDALHGRAQLAAHVECAHQVACADALLVSKTDRADAGTIAALHAELRQRNSEAAILDVKQGRLPRQAWARLLDAARPRHEREGGGVHPAPSHDHGTDTAAHGVGIESFVLRAGPVTSRDSLQVWSSYLVLRHAERLLRIKGFVEVAGEPQPILVQGAFDGVAFKPWAGRREASGTELVVIAGGMHDASLRRSVRGALVELTPDACLTP